MGADAFALLRRWHRSAEIPFVAPLIVASRPGEQLDDLVAFLPDGLTIKAAPGLERSASQIDLRRYTLRNSSGQQVPFYLLPGLDIEISASEIRGQLRDHAPAVSVSQTPQPADLPATVSDYIRAHRLYR
jgi:nicotinate-nucleotide adenylyltransferase